MSNPTDYQRLWRQQQEVTKELTKKLSILALTTDGYAKVLSGLKDGTIPLAELQKVPIRNTKEIGESLEAKKERKEVEGGGGGKA